jgi:hypothetical protein
LVFEFAYSPPPELGQRDTLATAVVRFFERYSQPAFYLAQIAVGLGVLLYIREQMLRSRQVPNQVP